MEFPTLIEGQPAPHLKAYSKESAIAEKFEALVKLNFLTSRMKDVYDILYLAARETFGMTVLREAVVSTFEKRKTPRKDIRIIFSTEFKTQREKQEQWLAFLNRSRLISYEAFSEAIERLEFFLRPVFDDPVSLSRKKTVWHPANWSWL